MRYYLDTEFDESASTIISLGVVTQSGNEFYAVNDTYDWSHASQWLYDNVRPNMEMEKQLLRDEFRGSPETIGLALARFVQKHDNDGSPEFWGYKSAWDIVLVHQLFGGYQGVLEDAPTIPLVCYDINQLAKSIGVIQSLKDVVKPFKPEHNSLVDARWTKFVHEQIILQYGRYI